MQIQNPDVYTESDGTGKVMIWVWGDDFQTFEAALQDDDDIETYEFLTQVQDRRFYSITHVKGAKSDHSYPLVYENNILVLDAAGTYEGLNMRARFPTRDALVKYREGCEERGIPFQLRKLYHEAQLTTGRQTQLHTLTETQHETLLSALEMGYFDIPRRTNMEKIAERFSVSTQAISTRLRRGQQRLIQEILDV
ncbi:helix-turn-helix domain-containing protein [Haloarcula sp. 1CSR25-25]|jgi:predicted DNA binding protein|uniref:helix-turn-helix domain-containing protein n=1 Tax=Haloarcula sp. 1CSR25-25 TaxID=2862545 RepID=UPI0028944CBB|nr:helix-turn-helix domain-containing protein [Haloarcula sp. 1CSR25-25]MDT3437759.1 helix-turn-helix domain-containing protein [Haloarcula sp. 1CSR25-25]